MKLITIVLASVTLTAVMTDASSAQTPGRILPEVRVFEPEWIREGRFGELVLLDERRVLVNHRQDSLLALLSGAFWAFSRGPGGILETSRFSAEPVTGLVLGDDADLKDGILLAGTTRWPVFPISTHFGRAYVWDVVGDDYVFSGALDVPDPQHGTGFAFTVAVVDHDAVVVGRYGEILTTGLRGSMYLFERTPGGWVNTQKFWVPQSQVPVSSGCGYSLAYDDGYLAAGELNSLQVNVFRRDASGRFVYHQRISAPQGVGFRNDFGVKVAIEGDLMAIGNPGKVDNGAPSTVHIYRNLQGVWTPEETLVASDGYVTQLSSGVVNDDFGRSIVIDGGRIAIGARHSARGVVPTSGSQFLGNAYVFEKIAGHWEEVYQLQNSVPEPGAFYANSIDMDGDAVILGALSFPFMGYNNVGAAFAFELPFGDAACVGAANSTGGPGEIEVTGDRRIGIGRLFLTARELPAGSACLFLASPTAGFVANPAGSQGNLCLQGSIARFVSLAGQASATGIFEAQLDMAAIPTPQAGPIALQPGDTYTFQAWYRDANPGPVSNFTAARTVEFR